MTLKAKRDIDPDMRAALTSSDGIMPVGALPKMEGLNAQGSKALVEAMGKVTAAPKRRPKPKEDDKSEPAEPLTTEAKGKGLLQEMLKDAADARTQSIKLCDMEFAEALSQELLEYAAKMEGYYKKLAQAIKEKTKEAELKGLIDKISGIMTGGGKAQAGTWGLDKRQNAPCLYQTCCSLTHSILSVFCSLSLSNMSPKKRASTSHSLNLRCVL